MAVVNFVFKAVYLNLKESQRMKKSNLFYSHIVKHNFPFYINHFFQSEISKVSKNTVCQILIVHDSSKYASNLSLFLNDWTFYVPNSHC